MIIAEIKRLRFKSQGSKNEGSVPMRGQTPIINHNDNFVAYLTFALMTIARRLVVTFFLVIALTGCTLKLTSAKSALAERYVGGLPVQSWELTEQQLRLLSAWFEVRQSGWSRSYVTYVPATYVQVAHVGGQSSTINIRSRTKVVVNHDGSQMEQQFEAASVQALISIVMPNGGKQDAQLHSLQH